MRFSYGATAIALFSAFSLSAVSASEVPATAQETASAVVMNNHATESSSEAAPVAEEHQAEFPTGIDWQITQLMVVAFKYLDGDGVEADPVLAAKYFKEASELGSAQAKFYLASLYRHGEGVEKDLKKSFELIRESAESGYLPGQVILAEAYIRGTECEKNIEEAKRLLQKGSEAGHAISAVMLYELLGATAAPEEEKQKAVAVIEKLKAESTAQELFAVSYAYANGHQLPTDEAKAAEWAKNAEIKGEPNAAFWLAEYHWKRKNYYQSLSYYKKAARGGLPEAALAAARIYRTGIEDIPSDVGASLKFFEKAADFVTAEEALYVLNTYAAGPAELQNTKSAERWITVYTNLASDKELLNNADKYWRGDKVRRNYDLGGAFMLAALKRGNKDAVCPYARMIATPNWAHKDLVSAYVLLDQCTLDHPNQKEWKDALNALESHLNPDELRRAQSTPSNEVFKQLVKP